LWFEDRLVVPKNKDLKKKILDEAHLSKFSMHPGSTKMYHDLKPHVLVDQDEKRDSPVYIRM
jgi:hypothetical protein